MTEPSPFISGYRLIDGDELNDQLANPSWSTSGPVSATPGGTLTSSAKITFTITDLTTVTAGSGVTLPQALPGRVFLIVNNGVHAVTVFAEGGSTIDGIPGNIGVLIQPGSAEFITATDTLAWTTIKPQIVAPPVLVGTVGYLYSDGTNPIYGVITNYQSKLALLSFSGSTGSGPGDTWLAVVEDDLNLTHNDTQDAIGIRYNGAMWPVGTAIWTYVKSVLQAKYGWTNPQANAYIAAVQALAFTIG